MSVNWTEQSRGGQILYSASCPGVDEPAIKAGLEAAMEKAVGLLDSNVGDDSRYLLCQWDAASATLTVVVTDDSKQQDAPGVVQCRLENVNQGVDGDLVHFLIRDYLTTCTAFLGWSLLAAFHEGDRQQSRLL